MRKRRQPIDRFMAKVHSVDSGCQLWTGTTGGSNSKYGYFRPGTLPEDPKVMAHRWIYEHSVGVIPVGFEIDHRCRTPLCVNVNHLEAVTHEENMRRARLQTCRKGLHDLTDPAACRWDSMGRRRGCKTCWQQSQAAKKRR